MSKFKSPPEARQRELIAERYIAQTYPMPDLSENHLEADAAGSTSTMALYMESDEVIGLIAHNHGISTEALPPESGSKLRFKEAAEILCVQIAKGNVETLGWKGDWPSRTIIGDAVETIETKYFATGEATIMRGGWATKADLDVRREFHTGGAGETEWAGDDWGRLHCKREDVRRLWPIGGTDQANTSNSNKISDENKMKTWLTTRMKNDPDNPVSKKTIRAEAVSSGIVDISERGFDRAYKNAVEASGAAAWSAAGRRRKSAH
jgi:hypothetical protein